MTKPIISFIVLILSIGFAFFYVVPAYNLNKERRGDVESLSNILSTSGEIKTLIEETKKSLASISPSGLSSFEVFLPEKIDAIRFANNIQYIGKKNGIILSDIKVEGLASGAQSSVAQSDISATQGLVNAVSLGAKVNQAEGAYTMNPTTGVAEESAYKKYVATKASFTFTSTFEAFQLLLYDLERSLGVIDVTALSFSPVTQVSPANGLRTPSSPTYQYTMAIETYSLK